MRRLRRPLVAVCVVGVSALAWAAPAGADPPNRYGWWWQANQAPANALTAPPAPPDAPPDGMWLSAAPSGALSVAALHFNAGASGGDSTLTLASTNGGFGAATPILACPVSGHQWAAAAGGAWAARPSPDCAAAKGGVAGVASATGATMTWKLGAAFAPSPGEYDVVLLPQPQGFFEVPLAKPGDGALTLAAPPPPPGSDVPSALDAQALQATEPAVASPLPQPVPVPSFDAGPLAPPTPVQPAPRAPAPRRPVAVLAAPTGRVAAAPGADQRAQRVMAVALLGLLGAMLWWLEGRPPRLPRALGALQAVAGRAPSTPGHRAGVRGIGRFARPRTSAPNRL